MVILKVGWKKRSADVLFAASEPERVQQTGRRGRERLMLQSSCQFFTVYEYFLGEEEIRISIHYCYIIFFVQ